MFAGIIHSKSGAVRNNTRNKSPEWTSESYLKLIGSAEASQPDHPCRAALKVKSRLQKDAAIARRRRSEETAGQRLRLVEKGR